MMSSRKDNLPPGLSSMWRLCKLGYRHEPGMLLASFFMSLFAALPDALDCGLAESARGDGVLQHNNTRVVAAAIGLGFSVTGTWFSQDRKHANTAALSRQSDDRSSKSHVEQSSRPFKTPTIGASGNSPEYLDRGSACCGIQVFVPRPHVHVLVHDVFRGFCGWA